MNMKKIIMVLISMALVFTMAGAVSADEDVTFDSEASGSGSTTVAIQAGLFGTEVIITFPDAVYLIGGKDTQLTGTASIEVKKAVFDGCTGFNLKVASQNGWKLTNNDGESCEYTMAQGTQTFQNGDTILTVTGPVTTPPTLANYQFKTANTISESFATEVTDTLTFTVVYTYE